jgi:hypothetical protein
MHQEKEVSEDDTNDLSTWFSQKTMSQKAVHFESHQHLCQHAVLSSIKSEDVANLSIHSTLTSQLPTLIHHGLLIREHYKLLRLQH